MFDTTTLNTFEPVNQQIYKILRRAIISCQILPGVPLSEKEIAAQFSVSRQPVREAFIKLAEANLVQILPQRGTFVTKISAKKVIEGQFIREAVECAVIRRAAIEANEQDIRRLSQSLYEQKEAIKQKDDRLFLIKDDEFHQILINIIDCPMAWETVENIKAMMDRVRFLTLEEITPPEVLIRQHENILNALKEHDSQAAVQALREHLRAILGSIEVILAKNTDWFTQ
jgi:DNA-binding GntR family transcriptional regulator